MSLMDLLKQAQGGQGLAQLGQQFGMDTSMVEKLAGQLAPAISGGVQQRAQAEGGLGAILGQLQGEGAAKYFEQPAAIGQQAQQQGQDFLKQIFGTAEAAPQLAQAAAEQVGAPVEKVQELLPALAAMLQGGMQKQAPDGDIGAMMQGLQKTGGDTAGNGLGDLLGALGGQGGGGALGGLMGALGGGKSGGGGGLGGMLGGLLGGGKQPQAQASGGLGGLLQMLDQDGDGSPMNDIVGMLMKK